MTSDTARSALVALLFVVAACSSSGRLAVEDEPSESGSTPEASNRIRPDGAALTVEVTRVADGDSFRVQRIPW